jgi:hypothetical protein
MGHLNPGLTSELSEEGGKNPGAGAGAHSTAGRRRRRRRVSYVDEFTAESGKSKPLDAIEARVLAWDGNQV